MFRKHKITILAFMFGLIFLGMNIMSAAAQAQPDNFPIGMYIEYRVRSDVATGIDYNFTVSYEIIQWVDQERLIVKARLNNHWEDVDFTSIRLGCPGYPRLWLDVSTWQLQDYYLHEGLLYEIANKEQVWIPDIGNQECFRLESVTANDDIRSTTTHWYHQHLGILIDSQNVIEDLEVSSWVEVYNQSILGSNLDEFNPPSFSDPDSIPITTPTSTSTSIPTTSEPPVSSTSTSSFVITQEMALSMIVGTGIIIEVILLIAIVRSKND
ncbi:hypothetical protein EU528_08450 [Candidatus Thorarchaeota archaeon]|nr:MAG: hypothetical protein EU528_08450 [Candidatus Thorarchaeota archaeon]